MVASGELPDRRPDLPAGQPAAQRAATARAGEAPAARTLGNLAGAVAALCALEPADRAPRSGRALPGWAWTWRAGADRERVARGDLERDLPRGRTGRRRDAAAVPPVLDALRRAQPRQPAGARLNPRRGRAELCPLARVRGRVRQSGAARRRGRRRWRGGNRSAGGVVEGDQLPQSVARRRGAAGAASQRLQDREPDGARAQERGRAPLPVPRTRLRAVPRRRRRTGAGARRARRDARRVSRPDPQPAAEGALLAPALADD